MSSLKEPMSKVELDIEIMIGVDTHEQFHVAAAIDAVTSGVLDTIEVTADPAGYAELQAWADQLSHRRAWAIEGANSHGVGLTRALLGEQIQEVDRPNRAKRRHGAKNDLIDAVRAAREALGQPHPIIPRAVEGPRAVLQALMSTRNLLVAQATDAERQLRSLVLGAPEPIRERFAGRTIPQMVRVAAGLRRRHDPDPLVVTLTGLLKDLALRIRDLRTQEKWAAYGRVAASALSAGGYRRWENEHGDQH